MVQDTQQQQYEQTTPQQMVEQVEQVIQPSESTVKLREAKQRANQTIIQAEKFKATVENPKGKDQLITDDEFFHVTCHVDSALKLKIENGEYVELEKLLPKNRQDRDSEGRMNLVSKDGNTYFVPAQNNNKITNVRRWEQAFRVYAAVYNAANPHRSAEIWQYAYVINSAASTYVWDEVSHYDYTFRQLMSMNPLRSWATTYTQMWQMALRTPIQRGNQNFGGSGYKSYSSGDNNNSHGNNQTKKTRYCWKFNKTTCTDAQCAFPHKCYYCHNSHGIQHCKKKDKRGIAANGGTSNNNHA